MTAIDKEAFST